MLWRVLGRVLFQIKAVYKRWRGNSLYGRELIHASFVGTNALWWQKKGKDFESMVEGNVVGEIERKKRGGR